jgi:hypothetical protein
MEEPRPGIISNKTNRNLISLTANADYVAQYRVVPVIGTVPGTANDVERMAMKMDRMLAGCHGLGLECRNRTGTHRTSKHSSRNGQLHHFAAIKSNDTFGRNEILGCLGTRQNLE